LSVSKHLLTIMMCPSGEYWRADKTLDIPQIIPEYKR
jgi:hypothetical protein